MVVSNIWYKSVYQTHIIDMLDLNTLQSISVIIFEEAINAENLYIATHQ